jgi:hypothetical protein
MLKNRDQFISMYLVGCDIKANKQRHPTMVIYRQPELKFNPYTHEKMKTEMHQYPHKSVDPRLVKNYITGTTSDFTSKIFTKNDYEIYV